MTSEALRRGRQDLVVVTGLVAAGAGLLGALAAGSPTVAVAAISATVFGAVTLWRPFLGVLFLVAAIPLEGMLHLAEGVTALKAAGAAVFALWFLRKVATGESWRHLVEDGFVYAAAAFVLFVFLSMIWATNVGVARRGAYQLAMLLAWSLLLFDLVRSWDRADLLARVLVASGLVAAALTIQQSASGARRAGELISGGVNSTAVVLVSLIPLAFYLFRASRTRLWRLVGISYIGLGSIAVATTYSRMNLLLLPPLLLVLSWQAFRDGRNRGWLMLLLVGGVIGGAAWVPWDRVMSRAETIVPYMQSTVQAGQEGSEGYSGRGYHLRIGLEIARDHPVLGVGYNNYGEFFRSEYQFVVGGMSRLYTSHRSPHSSHVGILADLGIVGALLWLLLLGVAVRRGWHAWVLTRAFRRSPQLIFIQCLMVLVLTHVLAYGWYLASQKDKLFWLILTLAAALPAIASQVGATRKGGGEVSLEAATVPVADLECVHQRSG